MDPITRYNDIQGYLFNIAMLRRVFNPAFTLHSVRRSGPLELTTRWTMEMQLDVWPLRALWAPRLSFTARRRARPPAPSHPRDRVRDAARGLQGVSIMGVNPATGKFNRHEDRWDSLNDNTYFSLEGVADLLRQVTRTDSAPALESPRFRLLRRTASYEIREYDDFLVAAVARTRSPACARERSALHGRVSGRGARRIWEVRGAARRAAWGSTSWQGTSLAGMSLARPWR